MKNLFICLLLICTTAVSCKKFLAESSPDEIRPSSVQDMAALMNSDAYPYITQLDVFSDMLTDDVKSYGIPRTGTGAVNSNYVSFYDNGKGVFTFDPLELDGSTGTAALVLNAWKNIYGKIKGCNIVIDHIEKVSGTESEKNALRGQAKFLRGYYYLKLAQLYCLPYNGQGVNPESAMGVPLILSMQVSDEHIGRSTLKQTFDQIEKDLLEAAELLRLHFTPPSQFRVGHIAAYAMLSKFYLYRMQPSDFDKAIEYAGFVIADRPQLTAYTNFITSTGSLNQAGIYEQNLSSEIIWQYGLNSKGIITFFPSPLSFSNLNPPYAVSDELRNIYDKGTGTTNRGDMRYAINFFKYMNGGVEYASRSAKIGINAVAGDRGIRTGEVYITRAEALARRYGQSGNDADRVDALRDLNTLRLSRFDTRNTAYTPVSFTEAENLLAFCLEERRREMSFEEGARWADIKRLGLSVTHDFIDADNNSTRYVLQANSPLYALPIPVSAIERNNNLLPNSR